MDGWRRITSKKEVFCVNHRSNWIQLHCRKLPSNLLSLLALSRSSAVPAPVVVSLKFVSNSWMTPTVASFVTSRAPSAKTTSSASWNPNVKLAVSVKKHTNFQNVNKIGAARQLSVRRQSSTLIFRILEDNNPFRIYGSYAGRVSFVGKDAK